MNRFEKATEQAEAASEWRRDENMLRQAEEIRKAESRFELQRLPEAARGALRRYLEDGVPPGGFLTAILANDFVTAVGHADEENRAAIVEFATWLYWGCPSPAWGSYEQVNAWIAKRREERD